MDRRDAAIEATRPHAYLDDVEATLRQACTPRDPRLPGILGEAAQHIVGAGGKRLRPRLVSLLGRQLAVAGSDLVRIGAAAELMHAASLLHDDVVDEGQLRRGVRTVNAQWGNSTAVLAGDWVLTQALEQLDVLPASLTRAAIATAAEMSAAAIREVESRGRTDQRLDDWRAIAEGKTGALFAWCGVAVSIRAGRDDAARAFDAFGRRLGVAFQMADDLRDLADPQPGKDRFSDIRSRTPSSVLVLAMQSVPALRERLRRAWDDPAPPARQIEEIGAAILQHGVGAAVLSLLQAEVQSALDAARTIAVDLGAEQAPDLAGFAESFLAGLRARAA